MSLENIGLFTHIDHIALHVSDLAVSRQFYEQIFLFTAYFDDVTPSGIKISYLKLGGTMLELTELPMDNITGMHFCISTTDFDAAVDWLTSKQVPCQQAPHATAARNESEQGWRRAVFIGPDGEHIEIRG